MDRRSNGVGHNIYLFLCVRFYMSLCTYAVLLVSMCDYSLSVV